MLFGARFPLIYSLHGALALWDKRINGNRKQKSTGYISVFHLGFVPVVPHCLNPTLNAKALRSRGAGGIKTITRTREDYIPTQQVDRK